MSDSWNTDLQDNSLKSLPLDWSGHTREEKIEKQVNIIQYHTQMVSRGDFDISKAQRISALCLDAQMELSYCYADSELESKQAKHTVDFIENEIASDIKNNSKIKMSETELKRKATIDSRVKEAKASMIKIEKQYKKYRYLYEILKETHIFFRNIGKIS